VLIDHNANSSLTSTTEKENYPLAKTIDRFLGYVQRPETIDDVRLTRFNAVMLVLLALLAVIDFASYYVYRQALQGIEGVFFADGAQSDIMQTTEIAYSYIYTLRSQLANSSQAEFASTLESARLVNSYVYSLREADFASLVTNVTALTKDRLYAYIQQPTVWSGNQLQHQVLTHQFLENMYYLTGRVINELEASKAQNSTSVDSTAFDGLFANFPEMRWLNEHFLEDYQSISDSEH
jgi:hypothetical protein